MTKKTMFAILAFVILAFYLLIFSLKKISADISVNRTFNAPVEKVWALWTDSESIKKWWSPKNFTAPVIKNDFRKDGNFLFSMKAPNGDISWNTGTYIQIIPLKQILSVMSFADEAGNKVPAEHYAILGEWPEEVTILAIFESSNGKTTVTVKETGIPAIMYVFAKLGWSQLFDKIEGLLK